MRFSNKKLSLENGGFWDSIPKRCKGVHCVDLGESFPTHIYLQKSASIQPRTSPVKFARSPCRDAARRPPSGSDRPLEARAEERPRKAQRAPGAARRADQPGPTRTGSAPRSCPSLAPRTAPRRAAARGAGPWDESEVKKR